MPDAARHAGEGPVKAAVGVEAAFLPWADTLDEADPDVVHAVGVEAVGGGVGFGVVLG